MKFQVPGSKWQSGSSALPELAGLRRASLILRTGLLLLLGTWNLELLAAASSVSQILSTSPNGELTYHPDERGNRIPDFSSCGYAGGNAAIPSAPVRVVVAAKRGDSTTRIQRAIDYVASLPQDMNGTRGAVLLLSGRHEIFGGLIITNSGVVLRGQGMAQGGTVIVAAGVDRRTVIRVVGEQGRIVNTNGGWTISDNYVPVGERSFHVSEAGGLKVSNAIRIVRPSSAAWIELLDADQFGGGIGGGWKPGSRNIVWERLITAIEGNAITVDAPITTAIESGLGGGYIESFSWPGRISQVGIENLQLESSFDASNPKDENHSWFGITMENVRDAWVRQIVFKHFAGSAVAIYETASRVTVQDCVSQAPVSEEGGYRRNTFFTMGQQTLFLRCHAENGMHDFSVGHCAAGPNAFVQCEARLPLRESGPIESWASGVLYDNVLIDGNGLTVGFRPGSGRAVGWAAANSVLWNCSASVIRCENPPGAQNWAFGCWAEFAGNGIWREANDFASPYSLYEAQVRNRLGEEAAERITLLLRRREEATNPTLEKAQAFAAAAHEPSSQLKDFILSAHERDPIPSDGISVAYHDAVLTPSPHQTGEKEKARALSGNVPARIPTVDDLPIPQSPIHNPQSHRLAITNGWLTIDGRLLIGGTANVSWWRGNIRPEEADDFGLGITRFVPGRVGPGFTDDLNQTAEALLSKGEAALDHNYGLWYDRRRDDHQRVRRMNGDVMPPFYEQPFARSGKGIAWDGLSKYDLTKFNPWYWSRLRQFAGICQERGLVLFHQNYFQHNILEAGAHWADFPWRSANNVNETGFPEPPPYAGDKRIFQAELFYEVNHPIRRKLHESYIRQCLENFKTNSNVIQFTSAEFTGPLEVMQFWLDTIAKWEKSNAAIRNRQSAIPLIALSATKDVQDAILADAKRSAVVDVIDFRYWWRTDKGEFAPPGGKNLAPRQFERQWRGGRPNDANLAGMAAEYRAKFPTKPLICDFDSAGWAWLCAGGSMPRLPKTTDARLLVAIPRMQPWKPVSESGRWTLREPGRQMLVHGGGELDLTDEPGVFRVQLIDPAIGTLTASEAIHGGGRARLPGELVWLTKE